MAFFLSTEEELREFKYGQLEHLTIASGLELQQLANTLLDNLGPSSDANVQCLSMEVLVRVSRLPSARAFGVDADRVYGELNEFMGRTYRSALAEYLGSRGKRGSRQKKAVDESDEEEEEGDEHVADAAVGTIGTIGAIGATGPRLRNVHDLLDCLAAIVLECQGQVSELHQCIVSIIGLLCTDTYRTDSDRFATTIYPMLLGLCVDEYALLQVCNALLPLLLLRATDGSPSSLKMRFAVHKLAAKLVLQLVRDLPNMTDCNLDNTIDDTASETSSSTRNALPLVLGLTQRLLLLAPEKADAMRLVAGTSADLLHALHERGMSLAVTGLGAFILQFSSASKASYRLVCVETLSCLVQTDWLWSASYQTEEDGEVDDASLSVQLLLALLKRCNDCVATIRLRALSSLLAVLELLTPLAPTSLRLALPHLLDRPSAEDAEETMLDAICDRCTDDRALVCAKALSVLDKLLTLDWAAVHPSYRCILREEDLCLFTSGCAHKSLAVRKQALLSLTKLLQKHPGDGFLIDVFAEHCLPLIYDQETSIQTKLAEFLVVVLLDEPLQNTQYMVWDLCYSVYASGKTPLLKAVTRFILKAKLYGTATRLNSVVMSLVHACSSSAQGKDTIQATFGAWTLLDALLLEDAQCVIDASAIAAFASKFWLQSRVSSDTTGAELSRLVLSVLHTTHTSIPLADKTDILQCLLADLKACMHSPEYIAIALSLLSVCGSHLSSDTFDTFLSTVGDILESVKVCLHGYVAHVSTPKHQLSREDELSIGSAVFTVGAIAMTGFSVDEDESRLVFHQSNGGKPCYWVSDDAKVYRIVIPDEVVSLIRLCLTTKLPRMSSSETIPQSLRAHAFLCMGKLCVREKRLAKENLNIYLRELRSEENDDWGMNNESVRSNALIVLGDICIRHTSIVDRYVSAISACLQDKSLLVRKNAVMILSQLTLQDYLRWKGLLPFRFLACIADDDAEFAAFVIELLNSSVRRKFPSIFVNHISEAILLFNNCLDHTAVQSLLASGDGVSDVSNVQLGGPEHRYRRRMVYAIMLADLEEEEKILVASKLVNDVITYVVDTPSCLTTAIEHALDDAFHLLQDSALKVGKLAAGDARNSADALEDELQLSQESEKRQSVAKAKAKILKKLSFQHLVKHILPVVMSLKTILQNHRSAVQRSVMLYLLHLKKTHKTEVSEALADDPLLAAELEYDFAQFVVEEKRTRDATQKSFKPEMKHGTPVMFAELVSPLKELPSGTKGIRTPLLKTGPRVSSSADALRQVRQVDLNSPDLKRGKIFVDDVLYAENTSATNRLDASMPDLKAEPGKRKRGVAVNK